MMLRLYRGLVDILTDQCEKLNSEFIKHIRIFNDGETDTNNFGVKGFWNLLLEITYILYVKLFVALGIILTISLAIVFFPLHALRMAITNVLSHRAEPFPIDYQEPKEK